MLKRVTWFMAIAIASYSAVMFYNIFSIVKGDRIGFLLIGGSVMIGLLSQTGLFLAPIAVDKNLAIRTIVIVLMIPFIYVFLIPEFRLLLLLPFNTSVEGWKYSYMDHIRTIFVCLVMGGIYFLNLIALVRNRTVPNISGR